MYLIYSISLVHVGLALLLCPLSVHCKATDEESMHPPSEPTDFSTAVFEPVDEFHVSAPEALGHRLLRRDVSESRSNDGNRYQLKHSEGFVMAPGHTMERLDKRGFHFHLPKWLTDGWPFYWRRYRMPHVQDPETVLLLAKISSNVYNRKSKMPWFDVSMKNQSHLIHSFGWDDSFLRGYIYADLKREVVIIAFKGTDTRFSSDDSHDTAFSDKWMDNSMFSCCCSSGAKSNAVCGCQRSGRNQCSVACLADSLKDPQYTRYSYFIMAQRVFDNVRRRYPHSAIWLTGHSLGGALASLIGIANGVPAVTFEIPGDLRFARRLGLIPHNLKDESAFLSRLPVYHFGNVNDPIFMGSCNGPFSLCYIDGFSIETRCRTGKVCVYDEREYKGKDKSVKHLVSQKDMKGSAASRPRGNIFSHLLAFLIVQYLQRWEYVPECRPMTNCSDCSKWTYS